MVVQASGNDDEDPQPDANLSDGSDGYDTDDTRPPPPDVCARIMRGTYLTLSEWH